MKIIIFGIIGWKYGEHLLSLEQGLGTTGLASGLIGVKKMSNNPEIESDQAYTNRHYFRDHLS